MNGDYAARWLNGYDAVLAWHGERLTQLIGRRLRAAWLLWDVEEDEWYSDAPVLLDFSGEQAEINHQKFSDVAITWNTIDPTAAPQWNYLGAPPLVWRRHTIPDLAALEGRLLTQVDLLELLWGDEDERDDDVLDLRRIAAGAITPSFVFDDQRLSVFNALDQNGLQFGQPSPEQRIRPLRPT